MDASARVVPILAMSIGGKEQPGPNTLLEAARGLGTGPEQSVVFEDAIAGLQAGRAGGFAGVIGVARANHASALGAAGATAVVTTLDDIVLVRDGAALERS